MPTDESRENYSYPKAGAAVALSVPSRHVANYGRLETLQNASQHGLLSLFIPLINPHDFLKTQKNQPLNRAREIFTHGVEDTK